jgi:hypothetical protein
MGGVNHPLSNTVLHLETGIFYTSIADAARSYCIPNSTLKHKLLGRGKNNTNIIKV